MFGSLGRTVWEGSVTAALLTEMYHWGQASNSPPHTQLAIGLLLMVQDVNSKLLLQHHACLPAAVFTP